MMVISIHALREEGDNLGNGINHELCIFLSTPSARRATAGAKPQRSVNYISIHALREEGDMPSRSISLNDYIFLSTPSARRATGADALVTALHNNFYPRPPRGGRLP